MPFPAKAGRSDVRVLSFVESKLACKCEALLSLPRVSFYGLAAVASE